MKKTFILEELDCANCAAKMQEKIKKVKGVNDCSITFMTKKMFLDAEDVQFENIIMEVVLKDQFHLEKFIDKLIQYGETRTHIILSEVVSDAPIVKRNK